MTLPHEEAVLVIFPHPDDEAFGVSGTISTYIKQGVPVTYACLTLGEMGRNLGNPPFATRESLPQIRKQELQASADSMGLKDLRMMGLRDKTIEFEDDDKMVKLVQDLIEDVKPSLIITFYPDYSVHPDHEATARAVSRAVYRMPAEKRPTIYAVAFSNTTKDDLGQPDVIHDITPAREQKMGAMRAHISQTAWMLEEMEKRLAEGEPEAENWLHFERFFIFDVEKSKYQ